MQRNGVPSGRNLQRLGSLTALFQSMMPILFPVTPSTKNPTLQDWSRYTKWHFFLGAKFQQHKKTGGRDVKGNKGGEGWRSTGRCRLRAG